MKYLLIAINAKYIHTNPAVYSIKSYIEKNFSNFRDSDRNNIEIVEYTINQSPSEILADIYDRKPNLLAFSCYIWNWEIVGRLLKELPKIMPSAAIWLGGPEVSYDSKEILNRYASVTGIVIGEGEQTCKELFELYCDKGLENKAGMDHRNIDKVFEGMSNIKGIIYRNLSGNVIETVARDQLDLSELTFPYSDLSGDDLKNRIIYYESSRGCPFRCSYCLSAVDKTPRYKEIEQIKTELSIILAHEVAQVKFVDRTFNANHDHALMVWQFIRDNDNGITNFHFEIAADLLTDMEIELLKTFRHGLVQLEIGVQSTHPKTLESINRGMVYLKVKEAVTALRQNHSIHLHLDLIAGLPYDNYDTFANSFNDVYALNPEKLQLGFLKVLPGTPIRQDAEVFGIVYEDAPPYQVLYTNWLSYAERQRLNRIEAMLNIFYNTNQFMNTIAVLELAFKTPFQMYEKLADFFVEKDYFIKSPARAFRYQALLDFAVIYDPKNEKCYRELLTHDMYLREKTKTRPEFARDLLPFRTKINEFYAQESKERHYLPKYGAALKGQLIRMTAIEVFYYQVDAEKAEDKLHLYDKPRFIRYDYQKRDALTNNARICEIQI